MNIVFLFSVPTSPKIGKCYMTYRSKEQVNCWFNRGFWLPAPPERTMFLRCELFNILDMPIIYHQTYNILLIFLGLVSIFEEDRCLQFLWVFICAIDGNNLNWTLIIIKVAGSYSGVENECFLLCRRKSLQTISCISYHGSIMLYS